MSSLWTPSGEHEPAPAPDEGIAGDEPSAEEPTAEEIAALRELHTRLSTTPVEDVIANHALGLWQLGLVHLGVVTPPDEQGRRPAPNLAAAGLAIDALSALIEGLGARLGEHEEVLRDALRQAQMLFVEVADSQGEAPVTDG